MAAFWDTVEFLMTLAVAGVIALVLAAWLWLHLRAAMLIFTGAIALISIAALAAYILLGRRE